MDEDEWVSISTTSAEYAKWGKGSKCLSIHFNHDLFSFICFALYYYLFGGVVTVNFNILQTASCMPC